MTGKGPGQARETVIVFNEAEDTASVWTASALMYSKLKRMGYIAAEDRDRSASFEIPKRRITIRATDRKVNITAEQRRAMRERGRKLAENVHSSSGA